jgi:hypothetical protein
MVAGNLGEGERNKHRAVRARVYPQARDGPGPVAVAAGLRLLPGGLTLPEASAYRWPVTWCRPVPHVHGKLLSPGVGPRGRGWAVPAERRTADPAGVDALNTR